MIYIGAEADGLKTWRKNGSRVAPQAKLPKKPHFLPDESTALFYFLLYFPYGLHYMSIYIASVLD